MPVYDDLMVHLNPRVIIERTEMPHDLARAGVTLQSTVVGSYREFEDTIIGYVGHHMEQTLGNHPPPEFCLDKGRKFIDSSLGWDNAVYLSLSGAEGGIANVLNQVCDGFKKEAKQAYFQYILDRFIDPLSFEDIVELMEALKGKLSEYSPESFNYVSAAQMATHYREILWSYIESLGRYRNIWTY